MKALLTACVSLALAAACSSEHSGIEATPGFDPIGTEPTGGDADGGTGSRDVIRIFCNQGCENISQACPMAIGLPPANYCAQSCANNAFGYAGCEAEQLVYYLCLATTDVECPFFYPQAPECDPALLALSACQSRPPPLPER